MSVNETSVNIIDPTNAMILIQPDGYGHPVYTIDPQSELDALAGGERSFESIYNSPRFRDYVRTAITSLPGRITGTLRAPFTAGVIPVVRQMMGENCPGNIYVVFGCAPNDQNGITSYRHLIGIGDSFFTNSPLVTTGALKISSTAPSMETQNQKSVGAFSAGFAYEGTPLAPSDISGNVATGAANQIIALKREQCAGVCGGNVDIEDEWIFVTDAPGGGYTAPRLYYTANRGDPNSWVENILTGIADGNALTVDLVGNTVVVGASGTNAGAYHMSLDDVIAGTATGTQATGLGTNQVNRVMGISGFVVAVGQAGRIWLSQDGGFSYDVLAATTVITANNLTRIGAVNSDQVWVSGASGTLVRIKTLINPTVELITTGVADDFTCVVVPSLRFWEVYLGTDVGTVYVSENAVLDNAAPTFTERAVGASTGGATVISDMAFGGVKGNTLFLLQTNAGNDSRVLMDRTGGALGNNTIALGTFTAPSNNTLNSIDAATENFALSAGEIDTTYAAIVKVA